MHSGILSSQIHVPTQPHPLFHKSFSLVIHKSAKCPFQAVHKHRHRSSKMASLWGKELLKVEWRVQYFSSPQNRNDECQRKRVRHIFQSGHILDQCIPIIQKELKAKYKSTCAAGNTSHLALNWMITIWKERDHYNKHMHTYGSTRIQVLRVFWPIQAHGGL